MSQVVKLKRTAVEGKVPSTNHIELGELAINTFDGRIFFEKDNGTPSIQQVITTNSQTTGSINILGDVTASFFVGDGSQLTNLPNTSVSQVATVTSSFDNTDTISINHNFDSRNVIISVYDNLYSQLIPSSIVLTDNDNVAITLSGPNSGFVVVAKGGHIVSGSIIASADFNELSNLPTGLVSGSSQLTSSYDSRYVLSGSITQTTWDNIENKPLGIISGSSQLTGSYDTRYALSGSVGSTFIRTVETYTATQGQTIFPITASAEVNNVDVYINGFKLLTTDFDVTNSNTITLTTGSAEGEQVEINLYNAFAGTFLTTDDLNGVVSGSSQVEFNNVNNTPFSQSVDSVSVSKSIVPTTSTIDLGTAEKPFRDLYLSSASLYIDGQQVISSNASELVITTDNGQSIKLFEQGADDIILQTEDGNIELKGTVEIQTGKKIIDSAGNQILFGNSLGITGSISTTGNINGIDITSFSSSLSTKLTSLETKSGSVDSSISNINSFTSSNGNSSLNDYTSSLKSAISVDGANVTLLGNLEVQGTTTTVDSTTVQIGDNIIELNGSGAVNGGLLVKDATSPNTVSGSLLWDSTNDYWKGGALGSESKLLLANGDGVISGSSQITISSTTGYDSVLNQAVLTTSTPTFAGVNAGDSKFFNSVQLTDSLGGTCQGFLWTDASNTLKLGTGTVAGVNVNMTISGGNVGIGVTPSAWAAGGGNFQLKNGVNITWSGQDGYLSTNQYYNGSNSIYIANGYSNSYAQAGGSHYWYNAPSGLAGETISFTQAMSLSAAGNLSIGNTNDTYKLDVNGTGQFSSTGNALRIASTSTANNVQLYITNNNNGDVYTGVAASDGSSVFTGTTAYSGYIGTNLNVPFYIATGGTARLTLASTGAATFASSVDIQGTGNPALNVAGTAIIRGNNSNYPTHYLTTDAANVAAYNQYNASGDVMNRFNAGGVSYIMGGNFGLGTTSPNSPLEVRGSTSTPQFRISRSEQTNQGMTILAGGGNTTFNSYDGTDTVFGSYTFNSTKGSTTTQRMFITTDTTSTVEIVGATDNNDNYPRLRFKGGTYPDADSKYPYIQLGNGGLALNINGGTSTTFNNPTQITLNNGVISFSTAAASSLVSRMEIDASGYVTTDPTSSTNGGLITKGIEYSFKSVGSLSGYTQGAIVLSSGTDSVPQARGQGTFLFNEGNDITWYAGSLYNSTDRFDICRKTGTSAIDASAAQTAYSLFNLNSSGAAYNSTGTWGTISSDQRLKENIIDATPKLNDVLSLQVRNFNYIGKDEKYIGFIAQELEEVFPSLVTTNDTREYDRDGNVVGGMEDTKGVKVGMDFAILVKAIQEQQQQIEELKAEIQSLKNK